MAKQYWWAIIGPEDPNKYKGNGADGPFRDSVREAFINMFGHQEDVLASGWGMDQERYDLMRSINLLPTKKLKQLLENEKI